MRARAERRQRAQKALPSPSRSPPSTTLYVSLARGRGPSHARAELPAADPELVADPADPAVHELDCDHVLGGADDAKRGVGAGIKDFGAVAAVFVRRDVTVIALYIKSHPMRAAAALQRQ